MIITLLLNNWKKILFGGFSFILLGYCTIIKYELNSLKIKTVNLTALTQTQQNEIKNQKLAYKVLANEMQIRESAIENLNIALNEKRAKHENDQRKIIQNKTALDNGSNRISMLWLRFAIGDMSALPAPSATIDGQTLPARYILPSSAATGINQYIESCEIAVIQLNALIDELNTSANNYNVFGLDYNENKGL